MKAIDKGAQLFSPLLLCLMKSIRKLYLSHSQWVGSQSRVQHLFKRSKGVSLETLERASFPTQKPRTHVSVLDAFSDSVSPCSSSLMRAEQGFAVATLKVDKEPSMRATSVGPLCGASDDEPSPSMPQVASSSSGISDLLKQQETLREWFNDSHNGYNTIRMKKGKRLYKEECKQLRETEGEMAFHVREGQSNRYVNVELPPVVALRTLAALRRPTSGKKTTKEAVPTESERKKENQKLPQPHPLHGTVPSRNSIQEAILIQQHIRHHQLLQSDEKMLWRCLRCFHVFEAKPIGLLTYGRGNATGKAKGSRTVELSFLEKKKALDHQQQALRAMKKSMLQQERRRNKQKVTEEAECCPHCRSTKVQWMMEYSHYRTHLKD